MENDMKSSSEEVDPNLEIHERLQSMKKLLKRKERSLIRYNKAVKSRDQVRNSVLRKNFEKSVNTNGIENDAEYNNNNEESDVSGENEQMFSFFEKSTDFKKKKEKINILKVSDTEELDHCSRKTSASEFSNNDPILLVTSNPPKKLKVHHIINEEVILKKTETANFIDLMSNGIDHQNLKNSISVPKQNVTSNSTTPVLHRKRVRNKVLNKKKPHVKRLFQNNDNNDSDKESSPKEGCISGNCDQTKQNFFIRDECNVFPNLKENKINPLPKKESSFGDNDRTIDTNIRYDNLSDKKSIIINEDKSLSELSENNVLNCCVAVTEDGIPFALVLCTGKISIWNIAKYEISENDLIWRRCYDEENTVLQDLTRKFCTFGGGSSNFVYFFVIEAPSAADRSFEIVFFSFSPKEKLKVIRKSFPVLGCPDCLFCGHDLHHWTFLFFIKVCENPSCSNSAHSGTYYQVAFDVKYSEKRKEWDLELELDERRHACKGALQSVNILNSFESTFDLSTEHQKILWQDSSGNLGVATPEFSFPIVELDSNCELRKTFSSSVILYGAIVKEILFLLLKSEKYLEFVAMNPLSCQFDILYKIKLRDLKIHSKSPFSVIFYENKFFVVSSTAEVRRLVL